MRIKLKTKKGFTLTELAVAIAFISILLLTIATVTLSMVQTYHKGNTMKEINTVGLELISEFTDAISASSNFNYQSYCSMFTDAASKAACEGDGGQKFIFQQSVVDVQIKNTSTTISNAQKYGIFCTGKYSYVWNTGYTMKSSDGEHTKSSDLYVVSDASADLSGLGTFRLKKYQDPTRSLCVETFYDNSGNLQAYSNSTIKNDSPLTLLSDELIKTQDLAIFSLKVDQPVIEEVSSDALYTVHLILGSISGGIDTSGSDPSCNMDTSSSYDIEYCAANKFNFTVQTKGGNNI